MVSALQTVPNPGKSSIFFLYIVQVFFYINWEGKEMSCLNSVLSSVFKSATCSLKFSPKMFNIHYTYKQPARTVLLWNVGFFNSCITERIQYFRSIRKPILNRKGRKRLDFLVLSSFIIEPLWNKAITYVTHLLNYPRTVLCSSRCKHAIIIMLPSVRHVGLSRFFFFQKI